MLRTCLTMREHSAAVRILGECFLRRPPSVTMKGRGPLIRAFIPCKRVFVFAAFMLPFLTRAQNLNVPIVVQPAEWQNMATPAPTGTRTNAPVTFGIGIPDSAAVDCPGTPGSAHSVPTTLQLQNDAGVRLNSQFRCLARWPNGNAEWVLVDAQLPSFSEGLPGYDTTLHLIRVASARGNFPVSQMARQCTGAGTPLRGCPDGNHIIVTTGAATFLIRQKRYNLFDDVQVGPTHLVSASNHGPNDGLVLLGPPHAQYARQNVDSVSCNPGPIPSNYSGPTICKTIYGSGLDASSTCSIEENGPLRSALMCQGNMVNSDGDVYMRWRTRMHFWANRSDAKVTVALRNADVTSGTVPNFTNAYKEFVQFEARLTDNLGSPSSRNFDIAGQLGNSTSGVISASNGADNAYLYQAYSQNGEWAHWTNANNCKSEQDGCVLSPIPRTGSPGHWDYAADGYEIQKNRSILERGDNASYPVGWADLDDGTNGIEIGVYQLSMYWPKSLEFQPGTPNHNELRIGIWPDQKEFADASSAVSYAMAWPQYSIHDTYWNFHAGQQRPETAQNNFLYFQHYLLARPASGTYYNTVKSAAGFDALFYDIPDPKAEDAYYRDQGVCSKPPGRCLGDVGSADFPYRNPRQDSMKIFRYFTWQTGGGTDGNQFEQRYSFLRNWLQRGGSGNTGSVPGRYIWASHWYRMVVEKSLPRSDTATSGPGAGFRSLCTSLAVCGRLNFSPWGDPKASSLPSAWNGGMRNWGDDANAMEHSVYWGIFSYYFLSGDEWVKEQLLQGFKDRYQNPFVPFNNLYASPNANLAPGHGHINATRAIGHWFSGAAQMLRFLRSIDDPDADTPSTVRVSPGTSASTATVGQGIEQNIAASIALPFIASGYPQGWRNAAEGDGCRNRDEVVAKQLCSQGVSSVRGFPGSAGGSGVCGQAGATPPCDGISRRAAASFQIAIWAEGVYDIWLAMRELLGPNWHETIGAASGGQGVFDGQMGPYDVVISEKNLLDVLYGAWQQMDEENCVTTGSYATSGCVYTQFSDYLNSPVGCTSSGDCLRSCLKGCQGLTQWFALAAAAPTTNSTADLSGRSWQFLFESQLRRPGVIKVELGSHMMQFGLNYILMDGSNKSNDYAVKSSEPVLREIPITVSPSPCVGPATGTGTCTITWKEPSGLSSVNGETYRLKYWLCPSPNDVYGTDCPAGGKKIVPTLRFHSDTIAAGFAAPDGSGSWEVDPSRSWNWAFTTNVPDCVPGQTAPTCNPDAPSGNSYTFHTLANTIYSFSLFAYRALH